MDASEVKSFYNSDRVVAHYSRAAAKVGLWRSEEAVFTRLFEPEDCLLELGTGAGRIALGLAELGFRNILGIDLSTAMIKEARKLNRLLEYGVSFQTMDATRLDLPDGQFDGAIFGFNGLMQIPGRENRHLALAEVYRVLRPGAIFVFTTHDRDHSKHKSFWRAEKKRWSHGNQKPELDEFGDRYEDTPLGMLYIHVPTAPEIRKDLKAVGFKIEMDALRSNLANEPWDVRAFSDECRFWVVRRPED